MMRILVVEDEERLARLISRVSREEGHAPEAAQSGRAGLAPAEDYDLLTEDYDLLILNWMQLNLDGIDVIRRLGRRR